MTIPIYISRLWSGFRLRHIGFDFAVALISVGGAVAATMELGSAVKHAQTLFFFSVVLSNWFAGMWSGICAGLLSAIAVDYYFIPPIYALGISLDELPDMVAFVVSSLFVSWLTERKKEARQSVREVRSIPHAETLNTTADLLKRDDAPQAQFSEQRVVGKGLIQEDAEANCLTCTPTGSEQVHPFTHAISKRLGEIGTVACGSSDQISPALCQQSAFSTFSRCGDYWTIEYLGQAALLKDTRGLQCLASLLGHPGREFHVREFFAPIAKMPVAAAGLTSSTFKEDGLVMRSMHFQDADPILDRRAKAEYAHRLSELRIELEEAEQLNEPERARRARQERDCIAAHLAAAVGFGGRNRKAISHAERARSAVTKRIKDSIHKIAAIMPSLGHHLATTVKTGYFCSYSPDPDRPVKWEVRS